MAKITAIDEHFQHFLTDLKASFWGDLEQRTRLAWKRFLEAESERMRNLYMGRESYERGPRLAGSYRNGYNKRDLTLRQLFLDVSVADCAEGDNAQVMLWFFFVEF